MFRPQSMLETLKFSQMSNWDAGKFWDWADSERQRLNLSWSEIERDAKLSNASVSKRFRNLLKPTLETARALAQAFGLKEIDVLQKAGTFPPSTKESPSVRELMADFNALSDEDQIAVLEHAKSLRMLRGQQARRKKATS